MTLLLSTPRPPVMKELSPGVGRLSQVPFPILLILCLPDCPAEHLLGTLDFAPRESPVVFKCYASSASLRLEGPVLFLKLYTHASIETIRTGKVVEVEKGG